MPTLGIMEVSVGADFSFRRKEINRLFCKSTIHVRIFLIANKFAKAVQGVPAVFAQAFTSAPLAAARA